MAGKAALRRQVLLASLTVLSVALSTMASSVHACSCAPRPQAAEALKRATVVFQGTVIDITPIFSLGGRHLSGYNVKFEMKNRWKGLSSKWLVVQTGTTGGRCGVEFRINEDWLVYAHGKEILVTSICTRTRRVSEAKEDLQALGLPLTGP